MCGSRWGCSAVLLAHSFEPGGDGSRWIRQGNKVTHIFPYKVPLSCAGRKTCAVRSTGCAAVLCQRVRAHSMPSWVLPSRGMAHAAALWCAWCVPLAHCRVA